MSVLGRVLLRAVFWLGVGVAVTVVALACLGTLLRAGAHRLVPGRPPAPARGAHPILR